MGHEELIHDLELPFCERNEYPSRCVSSVDVELSYHRDKLQ